MNDSGSPASGPVDRRAILLVALLALVVSAPSITNGFAYDDEWIISRNTRVHDIGRWTEWFSSSYWPTHQATLYRPLSTAAFAFQWAAGDGSPVVFHAVNIGLATLGAAAFAWLALLVLPRTAAIVVAGLFAVHPAHVEAVANVVGQAELSASLAVMLCLAVYIRARRRGPLSSATTTGLTAAYLAAMFMKEHAIVLPAWMLAAECTVLRDTGPWRERLRSLTPMYVLLTAAAACALVVRWDVLGSFGGDVAHPALGGLDIGGRVFVMLDVLPVIARLLIWPARLYADYSPELISISAEPGVSHVNGALLAIAGSVLFAVAFRRSRPAAMGLALAFVAWLPTANLLMPSGVIVAERTLYLPSAGILLAAGTMVAWLDRRFAPGIVRLAGARAAAGLVFAIVAALAIVRNVDRQRTWRSTEDVLHTLVRDAPESFKAHHGWGGVLFERGDFRGGEREWLMAIRIFPRYHLLYQDLASRYRERHLCHAALPMYARALEIGGRLPLSRAGYVACELELARFTDARRTALTGILDGHDPAWFRARLRSADSALAANDSLR